MYVSLLTPFLQGRQDMTMALDRPFPSCRIILLLGNDSLTGQALASTIVPVHSDASTSTSVTASPMELPKPLDPPVELKIPVSDWEPPSMDNVGPVSKAAVEETSSSEATVSKATSSDVPTARLLAEGPSESREGSQVNGKPQDRPDKSVESSDTLRSERASLGSAERHPPIQLRDIRDIVGLERYHRSHASALQTTLNGSVLVDGLNRRLLPVLSTAYEAMAECYQHGDQAGFTNLYQVCEDLQEACGHHALQQGSTEGLHQSVRESKQSAPKSWLERMRPDIQDTLFALLTNIRTDPHFLADRLSALSFGAFAELCSSPYLSQSPNSVFAVDHRHETSGYTHNASSPEDASLLGKTTILHEGDPFFVLFHSVFDSSCEVGTPEFSRRTQIWSTACAKVITEGKRGSDEFTLASLHASSSGRPWSLAPRLEIYIRRVLQDGAFLLDSVPRRPTSYKEPAEIRNANIAIMTSQFFDRALKELLSILLGTTSATMMPDGLLDFIRSVLGGIPTSEVRSRARKFIVSKWYISSFLGRVLAYPEANGLLMDYHIGSKARDSILKEITQRLQKQVFDVQYAWKSSVRPLDAELHALVRQLLVRFDPLMSVPYDKSPEHLNGHASEGRSLMLSAQDVAGLLRSLYPSLIVSSSSASPSSAGSSTLVSESIQYGGGLESNAPGLTETSNVAAATFSSRSRQLLANHVGANLRKEGKDFSSLLGRTGNFSMDLDHRLVHLYKYLTSLATPKSTITSSVSAMDWAFFKLDSKGRVRGPLSQNTSMDDDIAPSGLGPIAGIENGLVREFQLCIIRLLEQLHLGSSALHPTHLSEGSHHNEANTILQQGISATIDQASMHYDYREMHYWWQMQRFLQDHGGLTSTLLRSIGDECKESIKTHMQMSREIEKQLFAFSSSRGSQLHKLQHEQDMRKALRMKMWYVSDVRHSSAFEDALHVAQALRTMANTSRSKQPSGVAHWARQRLKNVTWQDRSTAQVVEALTEPNEHSGTSKLNDDQVERTTGWLTRHSIEDFCRGEERIQRFCFEIQRCVTKLTGPTLLLSPVLWSSRLFEREERVLDRKLPSTHAQGLPTAVGNGMSSFNRYPYTYGAHSQSDPQPPTLDPAKGSQVFYGSPPKEPVRSLPFRTSHASAMMPDSIWLSGSHSHLSADKAPPKPLDEAKALFISETKKDLCSLLLSDLGYMLWYDGTETDAWVKLSSLDDDLLSPSNQRELSRRGKKQDTEQQTASFEVKSLKMILVAAAGDLQDSSSRWRMTPQTRQTILINPSEDQSNRDYAQAFPYRATYRKILESVSLSADPQSKLRLIHQLEHLVSQSIQQAITSPSPSPSPFQSNSSATLGRSQSLPVPRTKATSFEEVIANCTERRAGTMRIGQSTGFPSASPDVESFGTDEIVNAFLSIFRDLDLRPSTLFRDLQYIAAFVPAEILDQTPQGKAFWDAGLAALALKQELCDAMIGRATDITNHHLSTSSSSADSPPLPFSSPHDANLRHTSLQDAAQLWIIAAKEGSATAARELGLLYLTHPELLPRTTLQPFSKPKEVFRMVGARKEGSTTAMEEGRLDPVTFAVVFHWMEVAANGGDKDARDFLRGNGEWGMGR
ncbi:MAG: hypothetical protein Q9173_003803 [Seirophora scorigena]